MQAITTGQKRHLPLNTITISGNMLCKPKSEPMSCLFFVGFVFCESYVIIVYDHTLGLESRVLNHWDSNMYEK